MQSSISKLKTGSCIHLMGICGTAMASLAGLLVDRGFKVTGSDSHPYPPMSDQVKNLGITIMIGYSNKNLSHNPDFVIVGNVISANNEEAQELVRKGIPYTSLPQAMGELIIAKKESFVVSGTHGKTTTTSLLAWVTEELGMDPGFLIGGIPKNFTHSFRTGRGNLFVIEGDEYDTAFFDKVPKFVHYRPKNVILTSVEFDHADIYANLQAVKDAFLKLANMVPRDGLLVYWNDDKNVKEIASQSKAKKVSYGLLSHSAMPSADYLAQIKDINEKGTTFEFLQRSTEGAALKKLGTFTVSMTGDHNVLNTMAVLVMAHEKSWDLIKVGKALIQFQGVKRRQEILGEPRGILVIEDFAHHPTAVRETLRGIRQRYPQRKVFAVFEPRSATSRRKIFQDEYAKAFQEADEVVLAQAFDQSKIDAKDRFSSDELVQDIHELSQGRKTATNFASVDLIVDHLQRNARKGDLIIIMSNGGFDGIYAKLLLSLKTESDLEKRVSENI